MQAEMQNEHYWSILNFPEGMSHTDKESICYTPPHEAN